MLVRWTPIAETGISLPLGAVFTIHLSGLHGAVKQASCSAWKLLCTALRNIGHPVQAFHVACVASFPQPVQFNDAQIGVPSPYVADQPQFFLRVLVEMTARVRFGLAAFTPYFSARLMRDRRCFMFCVKLFMQEMLLSVSFV